MRNEQLSSQLSAACRCYEYSTLIDNQSNYVYFKNNSVKAYILEVRTDDSIYYELREYNVSMHRALIIDEKRWLTVNINVVIVVDRCHY